MTIEQALSRGYNLFFTFLLLIVALFAATGIPGEDGLDKLDDAGILLAALILLVWYFLKRNRFQRTLFPLAMGGLAAVFQIFGIVYELVRDGTGSDDFSNDAIGAIMLVIFFAFAGFQYWQVGRIAGKDTLPTVS
jgi:hypothetical protein